MKQLLLCLLVFVFTIPSSFGQIEELKTGVLVVRLKSNNRKIEALEAAIAKSSDSKNLKRQIRMAKEEAERNNTAIIQAFKQEYRFSDVLFMQDTATYALKAGQQQGFFLDSELDIDSKKSLDNRFFNILVSGKAASGAEGFEILAADFNKIPKPFPSFIRLNTLSYLMNNIFSDEQATQKLYNRLARKLQRRLEGYYQRVE